MIKNPDDAIFSNDDIVFANEDSCNVTFFSDELGILSIDLNSNLGGLFRGLFWGVGGRGKIPPV